MRVGERRIALHGVSRASDDRSLCELCHQSHDERRSPAAARPEGRVEEVPTKRRRIPVHSLDETHEPGAANDSMNV